MNSFKALGGYFGLELRSGYSYHDNALEFNSARSGFEYFLLQTKPNKVYLPKYICDAMLSPLKKLNITIERYDLAEDLSMAEDICVNQGELLVYVNYFGIKNDESNRLVSKYDERLLLDCSQAFYYKNKQANVIYSPRKFFGVSDGGYLKSYIDGVDDLPRSYSYGNMNHLLMRIDQDPESGYKEYRKNEDRIARGPLSQMSALTRNILDSIDYETARIARNKNFNILQEMLHKENSIVIDESAINGPLAYPFMPKVHYPALKKQLLRSRIYVPTYWPNVLDEVKEDDYEFALVSNMLALPIDQRYDENDMRRIIKAIHG